MRPRPNSKTVPTKVVVVGWKEYVALPEWGISKIKAKIDTGARTSALDVLEYEIHRKDGQVEVEFRLPLSRKSARRMVTVKCPVIALVVVKNSSGMPEQRPLIEAMLQIGPVVKRIQLTLTDRRHMCFRMLIGRKALEGDFVVDVSKKYLHRRK